MSETNKDITVAFYKKALFEGQVEDAFRLYAVPSYRQHNPLIEDGMEGEKKHWPTWCGWSRRFNSATAETESHHQGRKGSNARLPRGDCPRARCAARAGIETSDETRRTICPSQMIADRRAKTGAKSSEENHSTTSRRRSPRTPFFTRPSSMAR
jgi:hypothetical protein